MTWTPEPETAVGGTVRPLRPIVLAVDPGPVSSAWLLYDPLSGGIRAFSLQDNETVLAAFRAGLSAEIGTVVIEKVESFGMAVGAEVFETVYWSGRFAEAVAPVPVERIGRRVVKLHLCGSSRATDSNIRQALIDRFSTSRQPAVGRKVNPGPLYGVSGDCWSALAVAVTWADGGRS